MKTPKQRMKAFVKRLKRAHKWSVKYYPHLWPEKSPRMIEKYRVKSDPPDYLVGFGTDLEFTVVARMLSKKRAEQIARLLNQDKQDKEVCKDIQKESQHIQSMR